MTKHSSLIITLASAMLYLLGVTFYQGYLGEFSLSESQFPLSIDQILFNGFISVTYMSPKSLLWLIVASEGTLLVALISTFFIKQVTNKFPMFDRFNQYNDNKNNKKDGSFVSFATNSFFYSVILVFVFIGLLLVLKASRTSGKEIAISIKKGATEKQKNPSKIIFKKDGQEIFGNQIVCNTEECAFLINQETVVISKKDISLFYPK